MNLYFHMAYVQLANKQNEERYWLDDSEPGSPRRADSVLYFREGSQELHHNCPTFYPTADVAVNATNGTEFVVLNVPTSNAPESMVKRLKMFEVITHTLIQAYDLAAESSAPNPPVVTPAMWESLNVLRGMMVGATKGTEFVVLNAPGCLTVSLTDDEREHIREWFLAADGESCTRSDGSVPLLLKKLGVSTTDNMGQETR